MEFLPPVLAYVVVANPATYKLTSKVLGGWVSSPDGAAKLGGLVLHAIVFLFLLSLIYKLFFPRMSGYMSGYQHAAYGKGHDVASSGGADSLEGSPLMGRVA
jgi:hypothetical protein